MISQKFCVHRVYIETSCEFHTAVLTSRPNNTVTGTNNTSSLLIINSLNKIFAPHKDLISRPGSSVSIATDYRLDGP